MLVCAEGLGPVRFDHWAEHGETSFWGYEYEEGEPVGDSMTNPVINCFATEATQAGNTYATALYMFQNGFLEDAYGDLDTGVSRIFLPEGGTITSRTSAAGSKDGGLDTFSVFDETHLWTNPRLKSLHATVTRNLRKRWDCWNLETSTMYAVGEGSVAEETHKADRELPHVLFDHKQAPIDIDIKDDEQLLAGLRYVYGPASEWMDIQGLVDDEFHDPTKRESESRRYFLNQPWSAEEKFTTPHQWDDRLIAAYEIPKFDQVVLGFDGSFNDDSTALVACSMSATPHLQLIGLWERPDGVKQDDWRVPRLDVMETIRLACKRWKVISCAADPYGWAQSLEELLDEGIPVEEFPQGTRMFPATKRFHDMIAEEELTWSGGADDRLEDGFRRHVLNANVKHDARGFRIIKDDTLRALKVDASIAAAIALSTAATIIDKTPEAYSLSEVIANIRAREAKERGENPADPQAPSAGPPADDDWKPEDNPLTGGRKPVPVRMAPM